jgi:hypothetical protein
MKDPFLFVLIACFAFAIPCAAKNDCDFEGTAHSVTSSSDRLILVLSGDGHLPIATKREKEHVTGDTVQVLFDYTVVIIWRRDQGASYKSWEDYCQQAKALEGKRIDMQAITEQRYFQNVRLMLLSCAWATLQQAKSQP